MEPLSREDFPVAVFALSEPAVFDLVAFLLVFFFNMWSSEDGVDSLRDPLRVRVDVIIVIVSHLS